MAYITEYSVKQITRVLCEVRKEGELAVKAYDPMKSAHEGYAVLLEEVDELWEQVKKNPTKHPEAVACMRQEAIQVAAMAVRFIVDVCDGGR